MHILDKVFDSDKTWFDLLRGFGEPLGPPREGLLAYYKNSTDSIGVSTEDYDAIGAILQPILFSGPLTPTPISMAEFLSIDGLSESNFIGTLERGAAIYDINTSRIALNRALRWFKLAPIYDNTLWPGANEIWPGVTDPWYGDTI